MKDHYAMLGIAPDATLDSIKSAYRKKAVQYHPDKNPAPDAMARFIGVKDAYEVLSNPDQRKAYDEYRQRSLIDDPLPVAAAIFESYIQSITQ